MKRFTTTTPKGCEGFNISYSEEKSLSEELLKDLPRDWRVNFNWYQIFFSDVRYQIDENEKIVRIEYNQNLHHWREDLIKAIRGKLEELEVVK